VLHDFSQIAEFLWVCDDILSKEECSLLTKEACPHLEDVAVLDYDEGVIKDRKSRDAKERLLVKSHYNPQQKIYGTIEKIEKITSLITRLPIENQEHLNIINYRKDGHYVPHYDFFLEGAENYEADMERGGQRAYSVLFYLNSSYDGGETGFPKLDNFKIEPRIGRVLFWSNFSENKPIEESLHSSLPVEKGTKWIGVKWVRYSKYLSRKS